MELNSCPKCNADYPDYHAIDEGGFLCEWCGFWSADPEPQEVPGCVGHMGFKQFRQEVDRGVSP